MGPDFQEGNCQQIGPEFFYPESGEAWLGQIAKGICNGAVGSVCPVRDECREAGLAVTSPLHIFGVWGGLSQSELKKEWIARRKAPKEEAS